MDASHVLHHELLKAKNKRTLLLRQTEILLEEIETLTKFLSGIVPPPENGKIVKSKITESEDDGELDILGRAEGKSKSKKGKPAVELMASDEDTTEDELDKALETSDGGAGPNQDDIRGRLTAIVKKKGEVGKKRAREILLKYTTGKTGQVKDIPPAKFESVYAELGTLT